MAVCTGINISRGSFGNELAGVGARLLFTPNKRKQLRALSSTAACSMVELASGSGELRCRRPGAPSALAERNLA
jgi:hypothetical protein